VLGYDDTKFVDIAFNGVYSNQRIQTTEDPVADADLTRKDYVDAADDLKVNLAGDKMTGTLEIENRTINAQITLDGPATGGNAAVVMQREGAAESSIFSVGNRLILRRNDSGDGNTDLDLHSTVATINKEMRGISTTATSHPESFVTKDWLDSGYVDLTTNQTIAGVKTFSDDLVIYNDTPVLFLRPTAAGQETAIRFLDEANGITGDFYVESGTDQNVVLRKRTGTTVHSALSLGNNVIRAVGASMQSRSTVDADAATTLTTKDYVDALEVYVDQRDNTKVSKGGDTMTGSLTMDRVAGFPLFNMINSNPANDLNIILFQNDGVERNRIAATDASMLLQHTGGTGGASRFFINNEDFNFNKDVIGIPTSDEDVDETLTTKGYLLEKVDDRALKDSRNQFGPDTDEVVITPNIIRNGNDLNAIIATASGAGGLTECHLEQDVDLSGSSVTVINAISDLHIYGNGFKFFRTANQLAERMFFIADSTNIKFFNVGFDDNRDEVKDVLPVNYRATIHIVTCDDIEFDYCSLMYAKGYAMWVQATDGFNFTNSELGYAGVLGLYVGHDTTPSQNFTIENNYFHDNATNAVAIRGCIGTNFIRYNTFVRNHIWGSFDVAPEFGSGTTGGGQLYLDRGQNIDVSFNTIADGYCLNGFRHVEFGRSVRDVAGIELSGNYGPSVLLVDVSITFNTISNNNAYGIHNNANSTLDATTVIENNTLLGNAIALAVDDATIGFNTIKTRSTTQLPGESSFPMTFRAVDIGSTDDLNQPIAAGNAAELMGSIVLNDSNVVSLVTGDKAATVANTGRYKITASIYYNGTAQRIAVAARVAINDVKVGATANSYLRDASGAEDDSVTLPTQTFDLNAGDIVEIQTWETATTGGAATIGGTGEAGQSFIEIERVR